MRNLTIHAAAFLLGCVMMPASAKVQPLKKSPADYETILRVREWTRERFALPADAAILVSEIACGLAGCPPLETVVAFWVEQTRYHFKFFKPLGEVVFDDFPPAWLREALAVGDGFACDCC
jgi:nitrate reductase delta subunit